MTRVLVLGAGAREHAIVHALLRSPRSPEVVCAPGNPGIAAEVAVRALDPTDVAAVVGAAREMHADLVVVGPEAPLVAGVVDGLAESGIRCFGPGAAAARLEGSKAFCKEIMAAAGVPTAAYTVVTDPEAGMDAITRYPVVIKADGLAAGKGVIIANTAAEARAALQDLLVGRRFDTQQVVVEEFLEGEEASFICMVDGEHILPLATSQDHKARDDGDQGPNTGGMGAYSPAPVVTPEVHARIMHEVIEPTVRGMAAEGHPYTGFLYAGLMITADGAPKVI
ncbi:MAG TPA: phosphoribosylamine--glycine ligase, partial [Solirubrobacteraceae bacterium]|nr:phosphoribosylamine--glycine ligase [Solirubrobacteraceae bacterium]